MDLPSLGSISGFSFASLSFDWIIIAVFALIAAFDAYRSGSGRVAAFSLALPLSAFMLPLIAKTAILGGLSAQFATPVLRVVLWVIVFGILFALISRVTYSYSDASNRPIQALIAGIAASVVLVVMWLQLPMLEILWDFGPSVTAVFGEAYRFLWLLVAYFALAFVRS